MLLDAADAAMSRLIITCCHAAATGCRRYAATHEYGAMPCATRC